MVKIARVKSARVGPGHDPRETGQLAGRVGMTRGFTPMTLGSDPRIRPTGLTLETFPIFCVKIYLILTLHNTPFLKNLIQTIKHRQTHLRMSAFIHPQAHYSQATYACGVKNGD